MFGHRRRLKSLEEQFAGLQRAHDEVVDELARVHGFALARGPVGYDWPFDDIFDVTTPRRFAYDETKTRTVRRVKVEKPKTEEGVL